MSSKIKACAYQHSTPMCRWYYWASALHFLPFYLVLLVPMRINGNEEFLIIVHENRESWYTLHSIDGTRTYHTFLFFSQFREGCVLFWVFFFNNQCRLSVLTTHMLWVTPSHHFVSLWLIIKQAAWSHSLLRNMLMRYMAAAGGPRHSRKPVAVTNFKPSPEGNCRYRK